MRILQTIVILFLIACQSEVSDKGVKPAQSQDNSTQESLEKDSQPSQQITNGIVFKDAQGNILTDAQKDSLVQYLSLIHI